MSMTDKEIIVPGAKFSTQQKLDYCVQWENSGMSKAKFCKMHGFSVSQFYYWYHHMYRKGKEQEGQWAAVTSRSKDDLSTLAHLQQVEVILPNQVTLRLHLSSNNLVSFIEELSHAAAIIR